MQGAKSSAPPHSSTTHPQRHGADPVQTLCLQTTPPRCLCVNKHSTVAQGSALSHSASTLGSRKLKRSRIVGKQAALRPLYTKTLLVILYALSEREDKKSCEKEMTDGVLAFGRHAEGCVDVWASQARRALGYVCVAV